MNSFQKLKKNLFGANGTSNLELYVSHCTFISNTRLKLIKATQHHEAELSLFENYVLPSFMLLTKNDRKYSKKCTKNKCVSFDEIIWLMRRKMSQRCLKSRHGQKCSKYKMCLSLI